MAQLLLTEGAQVPGQQCPASFPGRRGHRPRAAARPAECGGRVTRAWGCGEASTPRGCREGPRLPGHRSGEEGSARGTARCPPAARAHGGCGAGAGPRLRSPPPGGNEGGQTAGPAPSPSPSPNRARRPRRPEGDGGHHPGAEKPVWPVPGSGGKRAAAEDGRGRGRG